MNTEEEEKQPPPPPFSPSPRSTSNSSPGLEKIERRIAPYSTFDSISDFFRAPGTGARVAQHASEHEVQKAQGAFKRNEFEKWVLLVRRSSYVLLVVVALSIVNFLFAPLAYVYPFPENTPVKLSGLLFIVRTAFLTV